jgi:hypothetical protein
MGCGGGKKGLERAYGSERGVVRAKELIGGKGQAERFLGPRREKHV